MTFQKTQIFIYFALFCYANQINAQLTQQGPWNNPLQIATSTDGKIFNNVTIFQDSSGVPSVIKWKGDTLICAFQWFRKPIPSPTWDRVAVKFSYNNGQTWTDPKPINIQGIPANFQRAFDPTMVVFGKDSLRMYFSSSVGLPQGGLDATVNCYSARSFDGINYTFEPNARIDELLKQVIDPAVIYFKNQWHYTAPKGAPQDGALHYTSTDGLIFKQQPTIPSDFSHNWTGNLMVVIQGKLRFYGSGNQIWYNTSNDGFNWDGYINTNLKGGDPSVLQLKDNKYIAIFVGLPYVTPIKEINHSEIFEVYPNPFVDNLNLSLKEILVNKKLVIYNNLGQKVFEKIIDNIDLTLHLGFLPQGSYHIVIGNNRFSKTIYK
jgi:hypothetical protein